MSVREMKMESVGGLIDGIRRGETTARAGVASALEAADKLNEKLNAFLEIDRQGALKRADQIDALDQTDQASLPLAGVPIAIKDNICVRGMQTSCGSRILGPYHPPYNATVIEHVLAAGAIVLGKTNCDEFAMGSSNENSAFGAVQNPWDTSRVPGGSSGGSAVAVAAGEALFALGTDTGGSIRQPGALSGVAAMKPTYGRVSRFGVVAFASSLDQVGPFANTVEDCAIVCQALFGKDPNDATTMPRAQEDLR